MSLETARPCYANAHLKERNFIKYSSHAFLSCVSLNVVKAGRFAIQISPPHTDYEKRYLYIVILGLTIDGAIKINRRFRQRA